MKVPEKYRKTLGNLSSISEDGNNGVFIIPIPKTTNCHYQVVCSDGLGWEHVSVTVFKKNFNMIPTWSDMCYIKSLFWDPDETVIQYHPSSENYVNNHPNVLHLWRPVDQRIPIPPLKFV